MSWGRETFRLPGLPPGSPGRFLRVCQPARATHTPPLECLKKRVSRRGRFGVWLSGDGRGQGFGPFAGGAVGPGHFRISLDSIADVHFAR